MLKPRTTEKSTPFVLRPYELKVSYQSVSGFTIQELLQISFL
jgi:hypothetical protein